MKNGLIRIVSICVINFVLNYLLLFPLGLFKYLDTPNLYMFGLMGIVVSGIPAIATLLFYKLVDRKQIRTLGFTFKKKEWLFTITSIVVTLLIFTIVVLIGSNNGVITAEFNSKVFSSVDFYLSFLLVFFAWFMAAFYEEILFRGYFVANLHFLTPKKLYLLTNVIFMAFHIFKGYDLLSNIILMGMSCIFLTIYLKSGSLFPSTFAHLIFNFSNTHLFGTSDIALLKFTGDLGIYNLMSIIVFSIAMLILTNIFYRKKIHSNHVNNPKIFS
jgi:membrane protease YdiL (CAAX protease family)